MQLFQVLEIAGAGFSIFYSLLLMREKSVGWYFGIASSLIGVFIFYQTKIYGQAMISIYFAGVGIYGLWYWNKAEKRDEHINKWPAVYHVYAIILFSILSVIAAYFFKTYTDSKSPLLDSFITLFGLLASIKEARKILTSWVYWFVINGVSVVLYYQQDLRYYTWLIVIYTFICIPGFLNWYRIYKKHNT